MRRTPLIGLILAAAALFAPALASADEALTQQILHVLDYVSVDYAGTVADGQVLDAAEYAEQVEFAGRLATLIARLPEAPGKKALAQGARALAQAIETRAPGARIKALCRELATGVVRTYGVAMAPARPPDLSRAPALYAEHCAGCHGDAGRGDGPLAAALEPAPNDFHARERQAERSVYGLYGTITLGVGGTAMRAFSELADADRWALAFHVAGWYATPEQLRRGEALWRDGALREVFPDLAAVTAATPDDMRTGYGADGVAVLAYLRANPQAVAGRVSPLARSRELLAASLAAYRAGEPARAYDLAVAAYLEGFELAEAGLRALAPALVTEVERAMLDYRAALQKRAPVQEIGSRAAAAEALLARAAERLDAEGISPAMGFVSAFVILAREGLEAILVLAALITLLLKTGRREALRYVHAGWIAALGAGIVTWAATKYVITLSGAGRELTEGFTALFAAAMLVWVGCWLHDHAHADRWRRLIAERVERSMVRGRWWGLGVIAFVAVYREIVETILFYETLWLQAQGDARGAIIGGFAAAAAGLVIAGWGILRAGMRLPIRTFFRANMAVLFALAVIFAGKGISALQEAGKLPASPIDLPTIDWLGFYPTLQGIGLQLALVALVLGWMALRRMQERRAAAAG